MSELNKEWAQSIIKLGLIEMKKSTLAEVGAHAFHVLAEQGEAERGRVLEGLMKRYVALDNLVRDDKATAKLADEVVKVSRK
jgi:hypothetical protein